jgi:Cof subfamily protein (haloacid dehalogenase superfamily)
VPAETSAAISAENRISVLALDLDGTVVTNDNTMSERTVAAIARFRAGGGDVLIATGRAARSAWPWAVRLGGVQGMICHNGAAAYATLHSDSAAEAGYSLVASSPLPETVARKLIELSRRLDIHFHAYSGDEWLSERSFRGTAIYRDRAGFDFTRCDFDRIGSAGFFKAMFVDLPGPDMERLATELRALLGDEAEVMFTSAGFLEVVAPGISKAVGLSGWLAARGKSLESVLALGDVENDEAMLLASGIGVAMGDAPESLKAKVGRVTGTVGEDGAAAAIEAFLDGGIAAIAVYGLRFLRP